MRNLFALFIVIILLLSGAGGTLLIASTPVHAQAPAAPPFPKKEAILVLPIEVKMSKSLATSFRDSNISEREFQQGVLESVERQLVAHGYTVVDRGPLETLLKERNETEAGLDDPKHAAELAKLMGVKRILLIHITAQVADKSLGFEKEARVRIDFRKVDVNSGEIVSTGVGEGRKSVQFAEAFIGRPNGGWKFSPVGQALEGASKNFVKELQWSDDLSRRMFNVLSFDQKQKTLTIDGGERQGIKSGEEFDILREKEGESFDKWTVIGQGVVSSVQDERSKLSVTLAGDSEPKRGDVVRRVVKKMTGSLIGYVQTVDGTTSLTMRLNTAIFTNDLALSVIVGTPNQTFYLVQVQKHENGTIEGIIIGKASIQVRSESTATLAITLNSDATAKAGDAVVYISLPDGTTEPSGPITIPDR